MAKKKRRQNYIFRSISFLYKEGWKYSKGYCIAIPFYVLFSVIAPLSLLFIPAMSVKYLSEEPNFALFSLYLGVFFLIYIISFGISYYLDNEITFDNTFVRVKKLFRLVYDKSMSCDYVYFEGKEARDEKRQAEMALRSNRRGCEMVMKQVPAIAIDIISLLLYIATSSFISRIILVILIAMVAINMLLVYLAARYYGRKIDDLSHEADGVSYLYEESKKNDSAKDIRNYRLAKLFDKFMNEKIHRFAKYERLIDFVYILPNISNSLFGFIRDAVSYSLLITMVINGEIDVSSFVLLIGIINGISNYISKVSSEFDQLSKAAKESERFIDYLDKPSSFNHGIGVDINRLKKPLSIEFRSVSFAYPGSRKLVLDDLSFKIDGGKKIALVGENGAGKTTIIKLLSGFYKPSKGEILIDGKNIEDFNVEEYRSLLSVINQDVEVIGFPIYTIVSGKDKASEEIISRVRKCLKDAGLERKIDSLKEKERTYLTENISKDGVFLSGGEMQKLMLARALYKDGNILLLDEPTSALDPIAEGELYEKYSSFTEGKTSIFISHRLSSTRFCDDILFLKDGKIVEEGRHEELMKADREYASIFKVQAHYYEEEKV